ncbi:polyphenol oxidase family protein [Arcanobacterium ihumii]|uniref:polyphenol oxidase family protein n=1 Tax=Arcanobacterium ihumii TaxID=2138162 RepID=UPI000F5461BE|nr:polyphenol oxidase family protein [Arcanobacterium ihumii]
MNSYKKYGEDESCNQSQIYSPHGQIIRFGFTTRSGGVSQGPYASFNLGLHVGDDLHAVQQNRRTLERMFHSSLVWMNQVHGDQIADASSARDDNGSLNVGEVDAIIVEGSGIPEGKSLGAVVMVADCTPLILIDSTGNRAAAVHVGRAGLELNIAGKAVSELLDRGSIANNIMAVIGPGICGRCYELPNEVVQRIENNFPGAQSITSWGTSAVDIPRALKTQLRNAGVNDVRVTDICTLESDDYFSHRAATKLGETTGRFGGVVVLDNDSATDGSH